MGNGTLPYTPADTFVKKARGVGAPVTYMRIADMDHCDLSVGLR